MAFAAYVVALAAARGLSRRGLVACLGLALLWRAALVAAPPLLSNDINRYVWEGRVQAHGGDPYPWGDRPGSPRWQPLRDAVYEGLNHKDYTAVYPPLFVLAARGVVAAHDSFAAMKAFLVACELATLGALALVLRRRRLPLERPLVLAWSPLALVEIAGSGHNEAFGMLWLVEFRSEEGTARIVRVINPSGYPVLVFSVAHFHVIGQCYGSLNVSAGSAEFVGSGGHWAGVALRGKPSETLSWSKDKKGRDCLVLRREGQVDRLAFAVTDAKGKLSAPVVLTGELANLKTWFDDAVADFEETAYRFRKLTERAR